MAIKVEKVEGAYALKVETPAVTFIKVGTTEMIAAAFGLNGLKAKTKQELIIEVSEYLKLPQSAVEAISLTEAAKYDKKPNVRIY